jgi:hypothetical protein
MTESVGQGSRLWTVYMRGLPDDEGLRVRADSFEGMVAEFEAWLIEHGIERRSAIYDEDFLP